MMKPEIIYTDGSTTEVCFVIEQQDPVVLPVTDDGTKVTGNVGEYYALIHALQEAVKRGYQHLIIRADSQLMVRQLQPDAQGQYAYKTKDRRLQQLRAIVKSLEAEFESVQYEWVNREDNPAGVVLEERMKERKYDRA